MNLKIGVIGIGDIAKKAYLPITTHIKGIDLYIFTRNKETRKHIKEEYKSVTITDTIDELLNNDLDGVMIHSSTSSHYDYVKLFLENKIPVFVDKPISNNIDETKELFELAKTNNTLLRTGFNRRYVPILQNITSPDIILYQKNRMNTFSDSLSFVFDDLIHVVDTTRFLAKEPLHLSNVSSKKDKDQLVSVHIFLKGESTSASLIMHRNSGKTEEKIEVISANHKTKVIELSELIVYQNNIEQVQPQNNWESTLHKRGFEDLIQTYLNDIREEKGFLTSDEDSLETHLLCQAIYDEIESKTL